jgi:hypothetical protein
LFSSLREHRMQFPPRRGSTHNLAQPFPFEKQAFRKIGHLANPLAAPWHDS